jgi:hypothetical protein
MDQIIHRLETIHRARRAAPQSYGCDPRVAETVAACLRELHAVAAQSVGEGPRLRVIHPAEDAGEGEPALN